ncbi:hypothetical protein [Serratia symbiotica]|uniref:hypothetical protein n=1 Tax=Serratia symbiotica TaxID=138074 RepID=UPI00135F5C9D|nr:hypothetical protein [Serratia symbiotica]MBQ0957256.1 hypothetical protein [Serratia symbiotica]
MSANPTTTQEVKYSNNVYIPPGARQKLEEIVTEIGYKQGKVMSASAFVRYMIEQHGDQAKFKLIAEYELRKT